jgi:hypothetical protein
MSCDAKASKYPMESPFTFTGNNSITRIDPDGNENKRHTALGNLTINEFTESMKIQNAA